MTQKKTQQSLRFKDSSYSITTTPEGMRGTNLDHHLSLVFGDDAVEIATSTEEGMSFHSRLSVAGVGYGDTLPSLLTGTLEAKENTMLYHRRNVTEWYLNTSAAGSGSSHNNMPPWRAANFIIKT